MREGMVENGVCEAAFVVGGGQSKKRWLTAGEIVERASRHALTLPAEPWLVTHAVWWIGARLLLVVRVYERSCRSQRPLLRPSRDRSRGGRPELS